MLTAWKRRALVWGLPAVVLACTATPGPLPYPAALRARVEPAKLIFLKGPSDSGDVLSDRTQSVLRHIDYIESLPFDGMVVDVPGGMQLMEGKPLDYQLHFAGFLDPLRTGFRRFEHNFVRVQNNDPGDLFDDEAWSITVENWRMLARAARQAGFAGIFFDDEEYRDPWLNYPEDYGRPSRPLKAYAAQAELRGRQIMTAVADEFPEIRVVFTHGPYIAEQKTPRSVTRRQVNDASHYELLGPFFAGFVAATGEQARIVDGGEVYQYRSLDDFAQSYVWRKHGIADPRTNCQFIRDSLRTAWAQRVSIAFGIFNRSWPDTVADAMSPEILPATLASAMVVADEYVWFYAEREEWLLPGGVPRAWIDAVAAGRAAAHAQPAR